MQKSIHYIKFIRNILISKFNYQNPYQLNKLKSLIITISTLSFIKNFIISSNILLLLCGKLPKLLKLSKSKTIIQNVVTLKNLEAFNFLDGLINLILTKGIKSTTLLYACFKTKYHSNAYLKLSVSSFSLMLFPELSVLLPITFLAKLNSYLKLSFYLFKTNSI